MYTVIAKNLETKDTHTYSADTLESARLLYNWITDAFDPEYDCFVFDFSDKSGNRVDMS